MVKSLRWLKKTAERQRLLAGPEGRGARRHQAHQGGAYIRSTLRKASSYVRKNVMPDGKFAYKENGNMPRSSLVGVGVLSCK